MAFTNLWLSLNSSSWNSHLYDTILQGTPILNFMRTWLTVDTNIMSNMDGPTDRKTQSYTNHSCLLCKECLKIWLYENCCHLLHRICWYTRNRTYLENKAHQSQTQSQGIWNIHKFCTLWCIQISWTWSF